jgi:uncharacterized protein DUF3606
MENRKDFRPQHVSVEAPGNERPQAQDHWSVNLSEPWELVFWSREFGCTEEELKRAVEMVGSNAGSVRGWLQGRSRPN